MPLAHLSFYVDSLDNIFVLARKRQT